METMQGTLAVAAFVLAAVVLAATVPLWVPVVGRWFKSVTRSQIDLDRWQAEMDKQRMEYETFVLRAAWCRDLPESEWPALREHMQRWWGHYLDGRVSYENALAVADVWISRRVSVIAPTESTCGVDLKAAAIELGIPILRRDVGAVVRGGGA